MPLLTLTVQYGRTLEDSAAASSWRPSKRRRNLLRLLSLTIGSSLFLSACLTIDPLFPIPDVCQQFHDLPLTDLTAPDPKAVLEEVGVIKVMHGSGTAQLPSGRRIIKVEHAVSIPSYANQATVFLNGWRLNYLGGDQHVGEVGALITNINLDPREKRLTWNALGELRDNDFKEGYNFAYTYTVIAWNDVAINLVVDHRDCSGDTDWPHNAILSLSNDTTAMSAFSAFGQPPGMPPNRPVAVLPRGFGFSWPDHHILQIAYNLDHSEIFAEKGKLYVANHKGQRLGDTRVGAPAPLPTPASRVDGGFVSWDTSVIFKDNAGQRDYIFTGLTSALGGNDIGLVQPPFAVLPREGQGSGALTGGVRRQDFVIDNIPFGIAIPMLTGWELAYLTDDQHVKDVGVWIEDWTYSASPTGGTLRYTLGSILADDDNWPEHLIRHRVTLLGIRALGGAGVPGPPSGVPSSDPR